MFIARPTHFTTPPPPPIPTFSLTMICQIYKISHLREENVYKSYRNSKSNTMRSLRSLRFRQEHLNNEIEVSKRHYTF